MHKLNWEQFSATSNCQRLFYVDYGEYYIIWYTLGEERVECKLYKNDIEPTALFEANCKPKCNKVIGSIHAPFPEKGNIRTRFRGYNFGTAIAGVWTTLDLKIENTRNFRGVQLVLKNHVYGDNACLQVVDKDNILGYGNNITLDTLGDNWFVDEGKSLQDFLVVPYKGEIVGGLYLRLIYDSRGSVDVDVNANFEFYVEV